MNRPDVVIIMTDEERAAPPYETDELRAWRRDALPGARWFDDHGVCFDRHYTGSLACVPSRPTLFTGHYPDLHGVTQTDGLGKMADDSRMRWLRPHEVPTLGNWFRAAGYDTHYDGKWHISHADLDGDDGQPLATNTATGEVLTANVERYLEADPLAVHGFSGWVGPEPHGGLFANSGLARDALIADRVVAWLNDRYTRRRQGDAAAQRPFLLVASFVNPHDIVLFPLWMRRGVPDALAAIEAPPVPPVPPAPSAAEDLRTKPAAQVAYRSAYPSCYGPPGAVAGAYRHHAQEYRDLYHRLHAAVDGPLDRVRRAVTDQAGEAVLVRTSDHGDLLGAHGGLHQKWFQLYDEATRVPFSIVRLGATANRPRRVSEPTSHVDLIPTLLAAASIDEAAIAEQLRATFSEVHPLPGRNLLPVVDGGDADPDRVVYLMTRDNMPEGDTGANAIARLYGRLEDAPGPLRIQVAAHVATNLEGVVARVPSEVGGEGHLWKLVRTFDDPSTWTEPDVRQLAGDGIGGPRYRTDVLPDQWELYDLSADGDEVDNRADDPRVTEVFGWLADRMGEQRHRSIPDRNHPWPYATSRITRITKVPLLPPRQLIQTQLRALTRRKVSDPLRRLRRNGSDTFRRSVVR